MARPPVPGRSRLVQGPDRRDPVAVPRDLRLLQALGPYHQAGAGRADHPVRPGLCLVLLACRVDPRLQRRLSRQVQVHRAPAIGGRAGRAGGWRDDNQDLRPVPHRRRDHRPDRLQRQPEPLDSVKPALQAGHLRDHGMGPDLVFRQQGQFPARRPAGRLAHGNRTRRRARPRARHLRDRPRSENCQRQCADRPDDLVLQRVQQGPAVRICLTDIELVPQRPQIAQEVQ